MTPAAAAGGPGTDRPLAAVTGGTGFLGRHVTVALARAGWRIRLLVRDDSARPQLAGTETEIVRGSLADAEALRRLCTGADAVVHVAGLTKARDRAAFFAVNAEGSARLAAAAAEAAAGARIVLVSSLAAREPALSDYAASKRAGEDAVRATWRGPVTVLRPSAVYGPGDREILTLFRLAGGAVVPVPRVPGARLCLLHAADLARAVVALAGPGGAEGTFELSDQRVEGYRWSEIVGAAARAVGGRPVTLGLPPSTWRAAGAAAGLVQAVTRQPRMMTPGKAREMLHADWGSRAERQPTPERWRPLIGIDEGFAETAAWYRRNGWLPAGRRARTP